MNTIMQDIKINNPVAYLTMHLISTIMLFGVFLLALLSYFTPSWFKPPIQADIQGVASEYVVFKPENAPDIEKKELGIYIGENDNKDYNLTDEINNSYYFKITPIVNKGEDLEITHEILKNSLNINFSSKGVSRNNFFENLVPQNSIIVSSTENPLNINLEVYNENVFNVNLNHHEIENFNGEFFNRKSILSFSEKSIPKNFSVVADNSIVIISLPNTDYEIEYSTLNNGIIVINNTEIQGEGIEKN